MKIQRINWYTLVDDVKYWDAVDLIRNFEEEMENMRNGLIHWMLTPDMHFPTPSKRYDTKLLEPRISEGEMGLEFNFPNLDKVKREDINIEIISNELLVTIVMNEGKEKNIIGRFRIRIPDNFDARTCEAEFMEKELRIFLERKKEEEIRRIIVIH